MRISLSQRPHRFFRMGSKLFGWVGFLSAGSSAIAACFILSSCATAPWQGFPTAIQPGLVWPAPPAQPRIAYAAQIRNHEDLFKTAGFWKNLTRLVAGPEDSLQVRPYAVALHPKGGLLVADPGRRIVHFYQWSRRAYVPIGAEAKNGLPSPVGVAALADGNILVSDSQLCAVWRFDVEGKDLGPLAQSPLLGRPAGIAVHASTSEIFVADVTNHCIRVMNPEGKLLRTLGKRGDKPGEFNFPTHIAIAPDGNLLVSDSLNFRIQILRSDGSPVVALGVHGDAPGQLSKPKGIAASPSGEVFSMEGLYDVLNIFNAQGELLLALGGAGSEPGQFWLPAGLAFDPAENLLFVADSFNCRVQVFRLLEDHHAN